jgi:thiol-disulfide isomerase/thioredoxin
VNPRWLILILLMLSGSGLTGCSGQAPDEPFVLIDGRKLTSQTLRGGPVLVNFWATSCPTCIEEIPELVRLHRDYATRGLTVIGVAMPHDPPPAVINFSRERQIPYAIALDVEGRQASAFGKVRLTPTNILIDREGMIVARLQGRLDIDRTRQHIEQLLREG